MMKQIEEIIDEIKTSISNGGRSIYRAPLADAWPMRIALNPPTKNSVGGGDWSKKVWDWAHSIKEFARKNNASLEDKKALGVILPSHIVIQDEQSACRCVGMTKELKRRDRILNKCKAYNLNNEITWTFISKTRNEENFSDAKIDLLLKAGIWCRNNNTKGMTSRQIPVPGVQGKLLDNKKNRDIVCLIAEKDDLGLVDAESIVMINNLGPSSPYKFTAALPGKKDNRSQGRPKNIPHTVIIIENEITFRWFPDMPGAVAIQGNGYKAEKYIPRLTWLSEVEDIVYWGDMDADGLKILAGIRNAGVNCRSILMDYESFKKYEFLGTSENKDNKKIKFNLDEPTPDGLSEDEAKLFVYLNKKDTQYRRIEQEKIPYEDALRLIKNEPKR